jgi:hypothetical protein
MPKLLVMKGVSAEPQRQQDHAARQTRARPIAVGNGAGDRLHRPPDELSDGQREADRDDAQAGVGVDRRDEQAGRLARAHGDHQDAGGGPD